MLRAVRFNNRNRLHVCPKRERPEFLVCHAHLFWPFTQRGCRRYAIEYNGHDIQTNSIISNMIPLWVERREGCSLALCAMETNFYQ